MKYLLYFTVLLLLINRRSIFPHPAAAACRGLARLLIKLKRDRAALEVLNRAVASAPRDWRNYSDRAHLLFELDMDKEAYEDSKAAILQGSGNADDFELLGVLQLLHNEHEASIATFDKIARDWPGRSETYFLRSAGYQWLADYKSALADFNADLRLNPGREESLFGRAQCLIELEQFEPAWDAAAEGLKADPDNEDYLGIALRAATGLRRHEEGVKLANRLIARSGYAAYAYDLRADLLESMEKLDAALADREQAVKAEPEVGPYWNNLGLLHKRMENYSEALQAYDKSIELDPKSAPLYFNRALVWDELEMEENALKDFSVAVSLDPKDTDALYFRANIYMDRGDIDAAEADLDQAIKLASKDPYCYYLRGNIHEKKEELRKAADDYSKVIELDPLYGPAYGRRGDIYFQLQEWDKAKSDKAREKVLGEPQEE